MTTIDLDELERLLGAATPGPWFNAYSGIFSEPLSVEHERLSNLLPEDADDAAYDALPESVVAGMPATHGDTPGPQGVADAAFICAARNQLGAIIARIRELEAENRWIPVGERLPEDSDPVIVCVKGRQRQHVLCAERVFTSGVTWCHPTGEPVELPVTHWREFPRGPMG